MEDYYRTTTGTWLESAYHKAPRPSFLGSYKLSKSLPQVMTTVVPIRIKMRRMMALSNYHEEREDHDSEDDVQENVQPAGGRPAADAPSAAAV